MTEQNEETQEVVEEVVPEGCVCSEEEALRVIAKWAKSMGLDHKFEEKELFPDEISQLRKFRKTLSKAIMDGQLVIDDESQFVFTPYPVGADARLGEMTFVEPTVDMIKEARKERNSVAIQTKFIAKVTRKDEIAVGKMKQRNVAVCEAIVGLFLG